MSLEYVHLNKIDSCYVVDFELLYRRHRALREQPVSRRILVENLVRHQALSVDLDAQIAAVANGEAIDLSFRPARVLMQDYAGMPALIDLAALRSRAAELGVDPARINPVTPADLVIDHSVMAQITRQSDALERNLALEFEANQERYAFLKWAQRAFDGLRIVPPGQGIVHQVNTEYLADVVSERTTDNARWRFPDTVIGTDSHTTMVNGLGVLGWGVGGIEAEAVMLGEPVSMTAPSVVAVHLSGHARPGVLATDIVLQLTAFFRDQGVVGDILEFCGPGVSALSAADRLTIANMAPEFGAAAALFPVDERTLDYLHSTGRDRSAVERVERYLRSAGLYFDPDFRPGVERSLAFDLRDVGRVVAGPRRPHERRDLADLPALFPDPGEGERAHIPNRALADGDIVIASITSCTNTSNPEGMITAGLLARKARKHGLSVPSRVKSSLAPGSRVVADYLRNLGLLESLSAIGFDLVAFGCTTCVGNSGELDAEVSEALELSDIVASSVLSGNRNFEGRIHPQVKANFLASPPLVVAYALAGTMRVDLDTDPIGVDAQGEPVFLTQLWPSDDEIAAAMRVAMSPEQFQASYRRIAQGDDNWAALTAPDGPTFPWSPTSTYLRRPPFFALESAFAHAAPMLHAAKPLLILGDFVTTDHISPVGRIPNDSPAAAYLRSRGVAPAAFNAYGARRGEHEVMVRGTFAHAHLQNALSDRAGGWTQILPDGPVASIYDAAQHYRERREDIVILAGDMYGAGSARDWAAKGTRLLGVKAVIAKSFERIHRANLVRMGVLPLAFPEDVSVERLSATGATRVWVDAPLSDLSPCCPIEARFETDGVVAAVRLTAQVETDGEIAYLRSGGILPYIVERTLLNGASADRRTA